MMDTPSPDIGFAPAISANVGATSQNAHGKWLTDLALMCPGQRIIIGTRMPPSYSVPFWPRKGPVLRKKSTVCPSPPTPPLWLVKNTIVFFSSFSCLSVSRIAPTIASPRVTMAAYFLSTAGHDRSEYGSVDGGSYLPCGSVYV